MSLNLDTGKATKSYLSEWNSRINDEWFDLEPLPFGSQYSISAELSFTVVIRRTIDLGPLAPHASCNGNAIIVGFSQAN